MPNTLAALLSLLCDAYSLDLNLCFKVPGSAWTPLSVLSSLVLCWLFTASALRLRVSVQHIRCQLLLRCERVPLKVTVILIASVS